MVGTPLHRLPTRGEAAVFAFKANVLRVRRAIADVAGGLQRHGTGAAADYASVLGESVTPLWTDTLASEARLQLGKVHNLRRACARLHRTAIPAGTIFSFWKQVGATTRGRGYAAGRMLQEGCLVPSLGGGLCQLSNALYDVCLSSGCEIVERHAHSRVIPGSAAELGRDATVAWNYVDFRFRSPVAVLLEAFLRHDELVVRLRAAARDERMQHAARPGLAMTVPAAAGPANSCESCGEYSCFRHQAFMAGPRLETKAAFLFDECWPEFRAYVEQKKKPGDIFAHPMKAAGRSRYACAAPAGLVETTATRETLWRSWQSRRRAQHVASRVAANLKGARAIARRFAKALAYHVTTVYVEQSLLPYLWQDMELGGRTVQVFMTRLPFRELHETLDAEFRKHPERRTLSELRAADELVEAEAEALHYAAQVITPHSKIAKLFGERAVHVAWDKPAVELREREARPNAIAFAGPTVARKGAYELREAARRLDLEVLTLGNEWEGADFWSGVRQRRVSLAEALAEAAAFIQPALIEDKPRTLLKALAAEIPVMASEACGLGATPGALVLGSSEGEWLAEQIETCLSVG